MSVRVQEILQAPIHEVWSAITDPEQMREWYFENIPDFRPEAGFSTRFLMHSGERTFTATWKVTHVVPQKEIRYTWSYDEYDGQGPVTFKLEPLGNETRITVVNEGLESFPRDVPEFTEESCRGGWEYFLKGRLPDYLEKK